MAKQHQRNPVARAAILRKGGIHEKCRTGKRLRQKRELDDLINEYYSSREQDSNPQQNTDKTTTGSGRFFCYPLNHLSTDQLFYTLFASFVIFTA